MDNGTSPEHDKTLHWQWAKPLSWWQWWLTPRATSRRDRFYERNIRWITAIFLIVLSISSAIFIPTGVYAGFELFLLVMLGITVLTVVAVVGGRLTVAGWLWAAIFLAFSLTALLSSGYWAPNAVGLLLINPVLNALVIRRRRTIAFSVLLIIALYVGIAHYQQATGFGSIFDPSYSYSTPTGASIMFTINIILLSAGGAYLLATLHAQQDDLRELVSTLEHRVTRRTRELEIARQEAVEARDQALQADQVKSQFLANMSHELRTPLNAILNFTSFVAKGVLGPVNERQQETLEEAIESGKHLLSLINDILDITKIEAGMMDLFVQAVDMTQIMAATESIAKGLLDDKPVKLLTEIAEGIPTTYGDKRRLRQVMLNIASNAVKFTAQGQITLRASHTDGMIHLSVSDTGVGIAPEDQALVFESFKQGQQSVKEALGTGLGMAVSRAFVEMHGGRIWLESTLGVGTTFFVELPVLTEDEAHALRDPSASA